MLEIGSHSFEGQGSARFDDTSFQARVAQQKRSEAGNTGEPDEKGAAYAQLREAIREGDTQAALALIKEGVTPYSGMAPAVGDPSNETSDLIFAAASGDAKLVRALLEPLSPPERARRINERGPGGNTALHAALFGRDAPTIQYLKANGGDAALVNEAGQTPAEIAPHLRKRFLGLLSAAVAVGGLAFEAWLMSTRKGSEQVSLDITDHRLSGFLADVAANKLDAAEEFLKEPPEGFDINARTSHGQSALHLAVEAGDTAVVELLIRHGADASAADTRGRSAFQLAMEKAEIAGTAATQRLAQFLRDDLTRELRRELYNSANEERLLTLIEAGANVEGRFATGTSFLAVAAGHGLTRVVERILETLPQDLRTAAINATDAKGNTSLHWAVAGGDRDVFRLLTENGGDVDIANGDGTSAKDMWRPLVRRADPYDMDMEWVSTMQNLGLEPSSLMNFRDQNELVDDNMDLYALDERADGPVIAFTAPVDQPSANEDDANERVRILNDSMLQLSSPLILSWRPDLGRYRVGGVEIIPSLNSGQESEEQFVLDVLDAMVRMVGENRNPNLPEDYRQIADVAGREVLNQLFEEGAGHAIQQSLYDGYDFDNRRIHFSAQPGVREPEGDVNPDVDLWASAQNTPPDVNLHLYLNVAIHDSARAYDAPPPMMPVASGEVPAAIGYALELGGQFNFASNNRYRYGNDLPMRPYWRSPYEANTEGHWGPQKSGPSAEPGPVDMGEAPENTASNDPVMSRTNTTDSQALIGQIHLIAREIDEVVNRNAGGQGRIDMTGTLEYFGRTGGRSFQYRFNNGLIVRLAREGVSGGDRFVVMRDTLQSLLAVLQTRPGRLALRNANRLVTPGADGLLYLTVGTGTTVRSGNMREANAGAVILPRPSLALGEQITPASLPAQNMMAALAQLSSGPQPGAIRIGNLGVGRAVALGVGVGPYAHYRGTLNSYLRELNRQGIAVPPRDYVYSTLEFLRGHWGGVDPEAVRDRVQLDPADPKYAKAYEDAWFAAKSGRRDPHDGAAGPSRRDVPSPDEAAQLSQDAAALRKTLIDDLKSGRGESAPLSDVAMSNDFRKLVEVQLLKQDQDEMEAGSRRHLLHAVDAVIADVSSEVKSFKAYAEGEGAAEVRALAQEAWTDYLAGMSLEEVPLNTDVSQFVGYKLVGSVEDYQALLSGDEGTRTFFSSDEEFPDIIRFHQEKDGEKINAGVIDRETSPEAAGRAMYERDLQEKVQNGDVGFRELFELRFRGDSGRPDWSNALTGTVDEHLQHERPSDEDMEALRTDILRSGSKWTREELQAVQDSGVAEGEGLGWLKETIAALFYEKDFARLPSDQQYDEALDALAGYIVGPMKSQQFLPELDSTAKGHLAEVIKYHLFHLDPRGGDRRQSALAVRYHHGSDYLMNDIPGIVADRLKEIFGKGGKGAGEVVEDWFKDEGSDAHEAMQELISREYDGYVAYANWQYGAPDGPILRLWDR